jgi:hypothetical protein
MLLGFQVKLLEIKLTMQAADIVVEFPESSQHFYVKKLILLKQMWNVGKNNNCIHDRQSKLNA